MSRLKQVSIFTGEARLIGNGTGNTTVAPPLKSVPVRPQARPKPTVSFPLLPDQIKSPYLGDTTPITDKALEEEVEPPHVYPRIIRPAKPSRYPRAANTSERRRNPDEAFARYLQDQQNREAEKRRFVAPTAETTAGPRGPQTRTLIPEHVPRIIIADADEYQAPPPTAHPAAETSKPESYANPQRFQSQEPLPYSETIDNPEQFLTSDETLARLLQNEEYREADQRRLAENVNPIEKFRKLAEVFQDRNQLGIVGKTQDGEPLKGRDGSDLMFPFLPNTQWRTLEQNTPLEDLDFQNETVFIDTKLQPDIFTVTTDTEKKRVTFRPSFTPKNGKTYYIIAASLHGSSHYTTDMFNWNGSFTGIIANNVNDVTINQTVPSRPSLSVNGTTIVNESRITTRQDPWKKKERNRGKSREEDIRDNILKYTRNPDLARSLLSPRDQARYIFTLSPDPKEREDQLTFGISQGIITEEGDNFRLIPEKLIEREFEAKTRVELLMYTSNKALAMGTGTEWKYNTRPNKHSRCFMASLLLMMSRANIQTAQDLLNTNTMPCDYDKGIQDFRETLPSQRAMGGPQNSAPILEIIFDIFKNGDTSAMNYQDYQSIIRGL